MLLSLQRREGARLLLSGALHDPTRQREPIDRSYEARNVLLSDETGGRPSCSAEGGKVVRGEGFSGGSTAEAVDGSEGGLACLGGVTREEVGGGGRGGGESCCS